MRLSKKSVAALFAAVTIAGTGGTIVSAKDQNLTGAGSTFIKNLFDACIPEYNDVSGDTVSYGGGGSGAGRTAFINGTADFAATEAVFGSAEKPPADFTYVPLIAGPVAIAYKNSNLTGTLQLSPVTIAKIFAGQINTWNHPEIAAENPSITLPSNNIVVVYRADSSGTSTVFAQYLTATAASVWTKAPSGTFANAMPAGAPPGSIAAPGSDGVANKVASTEGSITYVELSFQKENLGDGVKAVSVKNAAGAYVAPSPISAAAAVAALPAGNVDQNTGWIRPDFATTVPNAYPITALAMGIARKTYSAKNDSVRDFFNYLLNTCAKAQAPTLGYAALTGNTLKFAQGRAAGISQLGNPALTTVKRNQTLPGASLLNAAGLSGVPTLRVTKGGNVCRVVNKTNIRGTRAGTCDVRVTVGTTNVTLKVTVTK